MTISDFVELDSLYRFFDRQRIGEHTAIGCEAQKPEETRESDPHLTLAVQHALPPSPRTHVVWEGVDLGVQKQVDVRNDHRRVLFATMASSSSSSTSLLKAPASIPGRKVVLCGSTW